MGGLYLISAAARASDRASYAREMDRSFALQGLKPRHRIEFQGHLLQTFSKACTDAGGDVYTDSRVPGRFVAACGTYVLEGATAALALGRVDSSDDVHQALSRTLGSYCFVWARDGILEICSDPLGLQRIYRSVDKTVWSSSLLAVASAVRPTKFNTQGIYEYVFAEQPHGRDTVFEGIEQHDPRLGVRWHGERIEETLRWPRPTVDADTRRASVEEAAHTLLNVFGPIATAFDRGVDSGLSGGYDSRLVLAALRRSGCTPKLRVYGSPRDDDVRIAKLVGEATRIPVEHIDKSVRKPPDPTSYAEHAVGWLRALDGCPADGVMGNGDDLATRRARASGGGLSLNGGGGEIFRNFFYLPDRPFARRSVTWAFYSQFDPGTATSLFRLEDYYSALESKFSDCVEHIDDRLSRTDVEWLYAGFRCRFWMARNNTINNRFGYYLTPLVAWPLVSLALRIPFGLKQSGAFEGELIRAIDPELAAVPTAYGHDLASPIPLRRRVRDQLTTWRPPILRRWSFVAKARIRGAAAPNPSWLPNARLWLGEKPKIMGQFFRVDTITHAGQLNRIFTLEALAREFGLQ